jgi:prophage regulatory protein
MSVFKVLQMQSAIRTSLLRRAAVEAQTGLARSTLYKLIKDGTFPAPVKLTGQRAVAWSSCAVDAWIASRIASGTPA